MADLEKTIEGLKELQSHFRAMAGIASSRQGREKHIESARIVGDAIALLKAQEPRIMDVSEVVTRDTGSVLWVEEHQGVLWNLFPLVLDVVSTHPDTGTDYLFFVAYHDLRKFECDEYNRSWRCWTDEPTDEQRKAAMWYDA